MKNKNLILYGLVSLSLAIPFLLLTLLFDAIKVSFNYAAFLSIPLITLWAYLGKELAKKYDKYFFNILLVHTIPIVMVIFLAFFPLLNKSEITDFISQLNELYFYPFYSFIRLIYNSDLLIAILLSLLLMILVFSIGYYSEK